jgi:heat shock protein HtpX
MNHNVRLTVRGALALALLVGVHLLVLAVVASLLVVAYAQWVVLGGVLWGGGWRIAVMYGSTAAALALVWASLPGRDRFSAPGPRLEEASSPALFALIREVAGATRAKAPAEVYLLGDVALWMSNRGKVPGIGSRRVLGLGLPLLHGLGTSELKALVAREFGLSWKGGLRIGPLICRIRAFLDQNRMRRRGFTGLVRWYDLTFLRMTRPIARRQEQVADELAARLATPRVLAAALERLVVVGPAFDTYWQQEVVPALSAGRLPPLAAGFDEFLKGESTTANRERLLVQALSSDADPNDAHLSVRERLAALGVPPAARFGPGVDAAASTLIGDVERRWREVLTAYLGPEALSRLKSIRWDQMVSEVHLPLWRRIVRDGARWYGRFVPDELPSDRATYTEIGSELLHPGEEDGNPEGAVARAISYLAIGMAVTLVDDGWTLDTGPGRPWELARDSRRFRPFAELKAYVDGKTTTEAWKETCRALGLAGRSLVRVPAGPETAPAAPADEASARAAEARRVRRRRWAEEGWF